MTIQELYDWAKKEGLLSCELIIDRGGYSGYSHIGMAFKNGEKVELV